jgi:hypothetical protein
MRTLLILPLLLLALPSWGEPFKPAASKKVLVGATQAFVPSGFDSKSEQIIIVSGFFPNGCYSLDSVGVIHKDEFNHEVSVMANVLQGICTMALVPYQNEVALGLLKTGKHKVKIPSADGTALEKVFSIE